MRVDLGAERRAAQVMRRAHEGEARDGRSVRHANVVHQLASRCHQPLLLADVRERRLATEPNARCGLGHRRRRRKGRAPPMARQPPGEPAEADLDTAVGQGVAQQPVLPPLAPRLAHSARFHGGGGRQADAKNQLSTERRRSADRAGRGVAAEHTSIRKVRGELSEYRLQLARLPAEQRLQWWRHETPRTPKAAGRLARLVPLQAGRRLASSAVRKRTRGVTDV